MSKRSKSRLLAPFDASLPREEFSLELRTAAHALGRNQREEALQLLAEAATRAQSPTERAKIAHLVALSQFELGRYSDAGARFREAARLGSQGGVDPQHLLKPSLGLIRCLLKEQALDEAMREADDLAQLIQKKADTFQAAVSISPDAFRQMRVLQVAPRPVRPSVALTRIGILFLEEGYLDAAKLYLGRVTDQRPTGGSRARQGLAHICLLEGDAERSERLAAESLRFGEFNAKTIPAWELSIQARRILGKPALDKDLYNEFNRHQQTGRVKERSDMLIISTLRRFNDPEWQSLAQNYRTKRSGLDPIVRTEVLKMLLNEVKAGRLDPDHSAEAALQLASEIYQEPTLAANEAISLAKVLGTHGLSAGLSARQIRAWLIRMERRFGKENGIRARHACARGFSDTRQVDEAVAAFSNIIANVPNDSNHWGRAVWSLARTYAYNDKPAEAAHYYLLYAGNSSRPPALRLQSFLQWVRQTAATGEQVDIQTASEHVKSFVDSLEGYRPLLDAGRQLSLAGPNFRAILDPVIDEAEKRALVVFDKATNTTDALVVIIALTRRMYYDFRLAKRVIDLYESFSPEKLNWLWSHDARFWEYLSLVMRAYLAQGKISQAEDLGIAALKDATTPSVGRVFLGIHYAIFLLENGRFTAATPFFQRVVTESPNHRLASHAHYWLALDLKLKGENDSAVEHLLLARRSLLPRPSLLDEWNVDSKAGLALKILLPAQSEVKLELYSEEFLLKNERTLKNDLRLISSTR